MASRPCPPGNRYLCRAVLGSPRETEAADSDLVAHDLDATVVDAREVGAADRGGKLTFLQGVGAARQLHVRAKHLGDALDCPQRVLRYEDLLGRAFVGEV